MNLEIGQTWALGKKTFEITRFSGEYAVFYWFDDYHNGAWVIEDQKFWGGTVKLVTQKQENFTSLYNKLK